MARLRVIAIAIGRKGAEIWAKQLGLQPIIDCRTGSWRKRIAMEIIFNGKTCELQTSINIQEFLDQRQLDCLQVVVEHNRNIISRQRLADTLLSNGDTLEVIHFVGGG